jgi:hypothetical protein
MRRLYLQIYAAFLGILLLFGELMSLVWFLAAPGTQGQRTLDGVGTLLGKLLPTAHRRRTPPRYCATSAMHPAGPGRTLPNWMPCWANSCSPVVSIPCIMSNV